MTLSKDQIETLFIFTEKKFVRWYDLQVELVDHLASEIEAAITLNPALSFAQALADVYAGFGIFGFAKIVREKEDAMRKASNKMLLKEAVGQFSWPAVLRSMAILALCFTISFWANIKTLAIITLLLYCIDILLNGGGKFIRHLWNNREKSVAKNTKRKPLLMLQSLPAFSFAGILYLQFMLMRYYEVLFSANTGQGIAFKIYFSLLLFSGIIIYISSKKISNGILTKAKTLYPEVFIRG